MMNRRYSRTDVLDEVGEVEARMLSHVTTCLRGKNSIEVARALVIVSKEIYRLEEEGRRLRLTGELDPEIYKLLVLGFQRILSRIMNVAFSYNLLNEVSSLRKALRFSSDTAGIYIYVYLRGI